MLSVISGLYGPGCNVTCDKCESALCMLTIEGRTIFAAVEQGTSSLYFFLSSGVHGKKCIFFTMYYYF